MLNGIAAIIFSVGAAFMMVCFGILALRLDREEEIDVDSSQHEHSHLDSIPGITNFRRSGRG